MPYVRWQHSDDDFDEEVVYPLSENLCDNSSHLVTYDKNAGALVLCYNKSSLLNMIGAYSSINIGLLAVNLDYCNQTYLDQWYPNERLKCKTRTQIDKELPRFQVGVHTRYQYFDQKDYDHPIKDYNDVTFYAGLIANLSQEIDYKLSVNKVTLYDSILSDFQTP
jgi:hypothetical protein